MSLSIIVGVLIFLALMSIGAALWEGIRKMDSATLQQQIAAGTPIDISQVRALEQQALTAINAGLDREAGLKAAFTQFTAGLSSQLSDMTAKYQAAIAASPAVNAEDYTQDALALQNAIDSANKIGLGTLADFTPPTQAGSTISVTGVPAETGGASTGDPATTGGATGGDTTGGTTQAAAPIDASDAANAAQTAQDQATAAANGTAVPVAVPPGADVSTHPDTGVVTVTLPAGTPVVQAAASDADQEPAPEQEAAPEQEQPKQEDDSQQEAPEDQQQSA